MRSFFKLLLACLFLTAAVWAQEKDQPKKPADVRFSPELLDKTIDPCTDFFAYSCSKWQAQNPIPADRSSWGRFNELQEQGEYIVHDILEKAAVERAGRTPAEQKIGDYYASCMNETAIEKSGTAPLDPDLKSVAGLKSKADLTGEITRLHRKGVNAVFSFGSG